jgi:hypothetical protein
MKDFQGIIIFSSIVSIASMGCNNPFNTSEHSHAGNDDLSYNVLLIGSSYFNDDDIPDMLENLSGCGNKQINIYRAITPGLYLADHAGSTDTDSIINGNSWDYVILQGYGRLTAYPEIFTDHPVYPALQLLRNKIKSNAESTKIIFTLPWAFEGGMAWRDGWTDQYTEMQQKIHDHTLEYSNDLGLIIAPVGWAWSTVLDEEIYNLYEGDWHHPSVYGSYLLACVIYSTIYKESTVGFDYYAGIPKDDALYFQDIASNMVLDSLGLWNNE